MKKFFSRLIRRQKQAEIQLDELYVQVMRQANYMLANDATLRETANHFGCASATIHRHMHNVLPKLSPNLYEQIRCLLTRHAHESIKKAAIASAIARRK